MQMSSVEDLIGRTIGASRPVRLLGRGKLSVVYEAHQPQQNRTAMFTLFLVPDTLSQEAREHFLVRFNQEATALSQLNHPAILPVYDFGAYYGYPYLVTPFVNKVPLAKLLNQRGHFSVQETLNLLQQIASCLDYAHSQNVVHGTLSSTNILVDQNMTVQVAGFGFMRMLEARGIVSLQQPYAHLLSIAGTFLGSPEYLAPEYVQGQPADGRIDVYALGVLLYELLSGSCPFQGTNPYEVAIQHVQQQIPSLHEQFSFVPAALDVVIDQALERNPAQRFQTAGALAAVFERVLRILEMSNVAFSPAQAAASPSSPQVSPAAANAFVDTRPKASPAAANAFVDTKLTMPPTVNWFDEEMLRANGLQGVSLEKTGPVQAVKGSAVQAGAGFYNDTTTQMPDQPLPGDQASAVDPFAWWSAASQPDGDNGRLLGDGSQTPVKRSVSTKRSGARTGRRGQTVSRDGRRRTVAILATGGVVALGVLGFGGVSLAHLLQKKTDPAASTQAKISSTPTQASVPTTAPTTPPTPTHAAPTPTAKPAATPTQAGNTAAPPPTATQVPPTQAPPTPTTPPPTPTPAHTGTVVGSTTMAANTSKTFTNPGDGQNSLLIHLANGNFVAYETACPHEGVTCYYDTGQQKIVCPRHNALFDPAAGARVLQGPPPRPLTAVAVHVNGDGTVTVG